MALSIYRDTWQRLLGARDYTAAAAHLAAAGRGKAMADSAELLKWDAEELALIEMFWKDARRVVAAMKPDDPATKVTTQSLARPVRGSHFVVQRPNMPEPGDRET